MSSNTLEKMEETGDNKVKWLIQPPNLFGWWRNSQICYIATSLRGRVC